MRKNSYMILFLWGLIAIVSNGADFFLTSCVLILISIYDIEKKIIPDTLILVLFLIGLVFVFDLRGVPLISRISGFLIISLPMLIISILIKGSFGGGDIKLFMVCGFILGWNGILKAFAITIVASGVFSIILLLKKTGKNRKIPLGPFISLGVISLHLMEDIFI